MTDSNQAAARFTRDAEGTWLIAVERSDAENETIMVNRKGRGPVRMRTGRLVGPHAKWEGFYNYERMSKAPTSGRMGENEGKGNNDSQPYPGESYPSSGEGEGEGQGQPQGQQPQQDMSEYVKRPELQEYVTHPELADVTRTLRNEIQSATPHVIEINAGTPGEVRTLPGTAHVALPKVLNNLTCGIHTYLVGPAGTGKTTLAVTASEALDRQLDICGAMLTKHEVTGYCDANGKYVRTAMRDAFEFGHIILWDEVDASSPAALVAVNAMLSGGGMYTFPDKTVECHPDFLCIAAGNTYGTGADREYVGRMQLDAATLDRFSFVEVGYDAALELDLGLAHFQAYAAEGADEGPALDWIAEVQGARANVAERKLRHVVSPRASINGCKLIARGVDISEVREMVLYKGCSADVKAALTQ